jgi:hypothetical protein
MSKTEPPSEFRRAYRTGLADFIDPGSSLGSLLLRNAEAYSVHTLVHGKIGTGAALDQIEPLIQPVGWWFLAGDSSQSAACHVGGIHSASAPKVTGFSSEPEVGDAINALRQLEAMPLLGTADFELRILRVPWLRFEALWLHTIDGEGDVVIPYSGFPDSAGLELMTPYLASDFLQRITPRALGAASSL